jgi:hypothetical protein
LTGSITYAIVGHRKGVEQMTSKIESAHYYKDRDHASRTIYVLVVNGERIGSVKSKREAEQWYRDLMVRQ